MRRKGLVGDESKSCENGSTGVGGLVLECQYPSVHVASFSKFVLIGLSRRERWQRSSLSLFSLPLGEHVKVHGRLIRDEPIQLLSITNNLDQKPNKNMIQKLE
jgi:hypothetical protein